MDIYGPIKKIAREALDNDHNAKIALRDILRFIAKEEENFRLRQEYYNG